MPCSQSRLIAMPALLDTHTKWFWVRGAVTAVTLGRHCFPSTSFNLFICCCLLQASQALMSGLLYSGHQILCRFPALTPPPPPPPPPPSLPHPWLAATTTFVHVSNMITNRKKSRYNELFLLCIGNGGNDVRHGALVGLPAPRRPLPP